MFGIIIISLASIFREIGVSLGKKRVLRGRESMYSMGFLNMFWGFLLVVLIAWASRDGFAFSLDSLPTFGIRLVLEIILLYVSLQSILIGSRSTVGFLRTITIPLLLLTDLALGYQISTSAIIGMGLIAVSLLLLFINHGIKKKGALLTVISAVLAVITTSLYKFNISHYNNSVGAEQGIMLFSLLIFLFFAAFFTTSENPVKMLFKKRFLLQSFSGGLSYALASFAYLFAPASVVTSAKRAFAVLMSIVSGHYYFKEKHFIVKLLAFVLIATGIVLLAL